MARVSDVAARVRGSGRARAGLVLACLGVLVASVAMLVLRDDAVTVDRADVQERVARAVEDRTGLRDLRTTCPVDLPLRVGHEVTCRVEVGDGSILRVEVRQVDDRPRLEVTLVDAVLDRDAVAREAAEMLARRFGGRFDVGCGPAGPVMVASGGSISCTVTSGEEVGGLVVSVDPDGRLIFEVTT